MAGKISRNMAAQVQPIIGISRRANPMLYRRARRLAIRPASRQPIAAEEQRQA